LEEDEIENKWVRKQMGQNYLSLKKTNEKTNGSELFIVEAIYPPILFSPSSSIVIDFLPPR